MLFNGVSTAEGQLRLYYVEISLCVDSLSSCRIGPQRRRRRRSRDNANVGVDRGDARVDGGDSVCDAGEAGGGCG